MKPSLASNPQLPFSLPHPPFSLARHPPPHRSTACSRPRARGRFPFAPPSWLRPRQRPGLGGGRSTWRARRLQVEAGVVQWWMRSASVIEEGSPVRAAGEDGKNSTTLHNTHPRPPPARPSCGVIAAFEKGVGGATDEEEGDQQGDEIFLFNLVLMVASLGSIFDAWICCLASRSRRQ
ncbi:hypothetical protein VPH35_129394 [Triticum aestivum]